MLLLTLTFAPLASHGARAGGQAFDGPLAADVFEAALAFIAPRTLDPTTVSQLSLWGLNGLTAIDPWLRPLVRDGRLDLMVPDRTVFSRPMPADGDAAGWARLVADATGAAWTLSGPLRHAGTQGVIRSVFDELFNHLDPYSRYVPPETAEAERDRLSGLGGVGITLLRQGGDLLVSDLVPDGPAEQAGLLVGDRILSVNRRTTRGLNEDGLLALLNGPQDTLVTLRVRGHDNRFRRIVVTRGLVPRETVFPSRDGDLLVTRITAFSSDTAQRLSRALDAGLHGGRPTRGLVVDLRGNRGGLLRQAVTAVALLLDHGLVASTVGRDAQATHEWRVDGGDLTNRLPVIVLVDGRSASAAEIMAAALADQQRGIVVGSTTLGKGLVQTITRLPDGGELFVTWSRVLAPLGWPIQGLGVMPQVCTSLGLDQTLQALRDLERGQQDLAGALAASRAARAPLPAGRILEIRSACPAAEGRDGDVTAAHFLVDHPVAYRTGLVALGGQPVP